VTIKADWKDADPALLVGMLGELQLIRAFEETVLELASDGLVHGPAHSSVGQEGGAVGWTASLRPSTLFAMSNLGMYGIERFAAIISPPQAGILAVCVATKWLVVDEHDVLGVATVMTVTLPGDHRVFDGALAAQWLGALEKRLEHPLSILT
jgi:hypothetical protein